MARGNLGVLSLALLSGACGGSPLNPVGLGPAGSSGEAGATATAGTTGGAGTGGAGQSGGSGGSAAGTSGVAGAAGGAGDGGAGAGGAPDGGGAGIADSGTAGMTADAGAGGAADAGTASASVGCGMLPADTDSSTRFVKKEVMVSGVDPAFIAANPPNAGAVYSWTKRNYYVRLPKGYDVSRPFPVDMAGDGCGSSETVGSNGAYTLPVVPGVPASAPQTEALQIGLSYVVSNTVSSCAMFADDYVDSPEPQYLDAVIDDVSAKYCVDKSRIFINGYAEGGAEAILAGCNLPDRVRGFGVQIGGYWYLHHPPCIQKPVAAMFVVGLMDTADPIGPLTIPQGDSLGTVFALQAARKQNGCVGDATAPWNAKYPKCVTYTGCPAKYPVVWCPLDVNHGNGPNPMGADGGAILASYRLTGLWDFFSSLPPP